MREPSGAWERTLERQLESRVGEALGQWNQARGAAPPLRNMSEQDWNEVLGRAAEPLTWRLWYIAIEEASRLARQS